MELEAKTKRIQGSSATSAGDRLSSLPDCILHEIMSRMKARQVVQTCVLATRWRHLWRSVPCLDIDLEEFKTAGSKRNTKEEGWDKFLDFTDHLLINNISIALLDTFRLQVDTNENYLRKQAARWIRHGVKYSSRSWCLKRLHLTGVNLDDSFMKHVGSECRYLEDLELTGCMCKFHEITSHSLKNLILKNCHGLSAITSPTLQSLVIDRCHRKFEFLLVTAPAVAYLHLVIAAYTFPGGVSLNKMPCLAKASIHLWYPNNYTGNVGVDQFKLLNSVSNVTHLYLAETKAMVLSGQFSKFQNLRTLLLEQCDLSDNFQTLGHFLQNSPNLEKITLRDRKFPKYPERRKGRAKLNKGCLNQVDVQCKNLKVTEIIYEDDYVRNLLELWLSIPGNLPKNNIKLTKVDVHGH